MLEEKEGPRLFNPGQLLLSPPPPKTQNYCLSSFPPAWFHISQAARVLGCLFLSLLVESRNFKRERSVKTSPTQAELLSTLNSERGVTSFSVLIRHDFHEYPKLLM